MISLKRFNPNKVQIMAEADLIELRKVSELEDALAGSADRPQLIFKHSLTCPISARAYAELERHLAEAASTEVDYRLIIVQHAREVSNSAAERLDVQHESPQAILVRNGHAVWHASHFGITNASLSEAVKDL